MAAAGTRMAEMVAVVAGMAAGADIPTSPMAKPVSVGRRSVAKVAQAAWDQAWVAGEGAGGVEGAAVVEEVVAAAVVGAGRHIQWAVVPLT